MRRDTHPPLPGLICVAALIVLMTCMVLGGCGGEKNEIDKARAAARKSPDSVEAQVALGKALADAELYNDAFIAFRRAIDLAPDDPDIACELAKVDLQLGDADRAINTLEKVLANDPNQAQCLDIMGRAHILTKQPAKAIDALKRAIKSDPKLVDARVDLVYAQIQSGSMQDAVATAKAGIKAAPNDADIHYTYGDVLMSLNKLKEAEKQFRLALKADSEHSMAMLRVASLLIQQKRGYDEARKLAQRAAEIDPGDGTAAATAAWALFKLGNRLDALNELFIASRAHPFNHHILLLFAEALNEAGYKEEAKKALQEAVRVAPRVPLTPKQRKEIAKKTGIHSTNPDGTPKIVNMGSVLGKSGDQSTLEDVAADGASDGNSKPEPAADKPGETP